jgi:hypothetical protein
MQQITDLSIQGVKHAPVRSYPAMQERDSTFLKVSGKRRLEADVVGLDAFPIGLVVAVLWTMF